MIHRFVDNFSQAETEVLEIGHSLGKKNLYITEDLLCNELIKRGKHEITTNNRFTKHTYLQNDKTFFLRVKLEEDLR